MNKIYDKLILGLTILVLAGGIFLYVQAADESSRPSEVSEVPADNPYTPESIPEPKGIDADWPEAKEQTSGWVYDVFTPPQIFLDAEGQFSIVPITPPPEPVPFGVYLAEIRRNLYRLQLEGYIEESSSDVSQSLLLFVDEEKQTQVRARPGDIKPDHEFMVRDFNIEREDTSDGGIRKVATATIFDQRRGEAIEIVHGERLYDSGITVIIQSAEDPAVNISLTEAPSEFETPSGNYTLLEINLEESSVTVEKHATEEREAETRTLFVQSDNTENTIESSPEVTNPTEEPEPDTLDAFESLFQE